jgi:predicted RNA binding protein YcfA (HicA-like mRNA interferase family)
MKYRDLVRHLEDEGWRLARTKGSHRVYKHPAKEQ